jgi:hypothetical protein
MRNQDIHKIPKKIFIKAGELAKSRILEDASKGIFQNEKKNLKYKSESYRKYKSKGMVGSKGKLKAFKNKGIDTTTNFVNMNLTGETTRRINVKTVINGFKLVFARGQIVEGNANRHGYDIFDLNKKNLKRLFRFFESRIEKNIKNYTSKPINIKIG